MVFDLQLTIVMGLACAYATYVVTSSVVFMGIRNWLNKRPALHFIPIRCHWCMSFWVSFLLNCIYLDVIHAPVNPENLFWGLTNLLGCALISSVVLEWYHKQ